MAKEKNVLDVLLDALEGAWTRVDGGQSSAGPVYEEVATSGPDGLSEPQPQGVVRDSIDEALNTQPRSTSVRSLRDDPVVLQFRQELAAGRVRANTANRLLELVGQVLARL